MKIDPAISSASLFERGKSSSWESGGAIWEEVRKESGAESREEVGNGGVERRRGSGGRERRSGAEERERRRGSGGVGAGYFECPKRKC